MATDALCFGDTTGSVDLTVSGGTGPYTYAWDNGATTEDLSGVAAGTYNVTITDAVGCTTTASAVVGEPTLLAGSAVATDALCNGAADGSVDLTVTGGTAPFTYAWDNGETTEDISTLAAGTYNVTITDANGCTATASAVVGEPTLLAGSAVATDALCNGDSTGSIDLTVSGGTAPFTYAWSNGETTEDISTLAAGTYNVTITDANGCTATASAVVGEPTIMALTEDSVVNSNCGQSDGSVLVSTTGGTAPFTYAWSNGDTTEDLSAAPAGSYTLTVTDANGCSTTISSTIIENAGPTIDNVVSSDPTLIACPILDNGTIDVTATGSNLEYSIDSGVTFQASGNFAGLTAGTYDIVIRDAVTGCVTIYGTPVVLTAPNCVADINVSITQTGGPAQVDNIGQTIEYTIVIENIGTLDVTAINALVTQPDGSAGTITGPAGDGGTPGVLDIGETWTYTTSYTSSLVDFQNAIDLINSLAVTSAEIVVPETDTAITPLIVSDLSLTKTIDNNAPLVGSNVVFTIEVTNDGKNDVTGVEVTDLLPTGYAYVSDDAAGNYDAISGIWSAGAIATGSTVSLNITANVNPTGDYDNVAEITAADNLDSDSTVNNNDPSEDDQDSAGATPQAVSDLSLTKVVDNSNPNVGADVVFTITVNNDGPSDATGVEVVDVLPSGYTYVSDDASGSYNSGTGLWNVGSIASGSSASLNITATVNVSGDYTNSAEVTASDNSDSDSTPGNGDASEDDQDSAGVTPNPVSDLELSKVVDNATPLVGENVIFTITVSTMDQVTLQVSL